MKTKPKILIYLFLLMGALLVLTSSCKKDDSISKKEPIITWATPADISFGILLNDAQLNATADIAGTFVYTPSAGTLLNVGDNQNLKVDFTPTGAATYDTASKTVKINVTVVPTITDIEGNVYKIVKIGDQWWMAENLKVTKYNNGDPIPNVTDDVEWNDLTSGAYCDYNNEPDNSTTYGKLYNWYALNDSRNIAPTGWHIPSDAEWAALSSYLGGDSIAGGRLKEADTIHWQSPNTGATNESGFVGLPGGYRYNNGTFYFLGNIGVFWSSTEDSKVVWYRGLHYGNTKLHRFNIYKDFGYSVRCIKD
jgi:uncharacterized protein (TIGR02145 family)